MITRKRSEPTRTEAKYHLKKYGWSYRAAGPRLGVTFVHLCLVLNGHRESKRLLRKVMELPQRVEISWAV